MPRSKLNLIGENHLVIRNQRNIYKVKLDEINYLRCTSYKTTIHLMDGSNREVCAPLKDFEILLSPKGFVKVHRNTLVNMKAVIEVSNSTELKAVLINGISIEIAYRRFKSFKTLFEGLPVK